MNEARDRLTTYMMLGRMMNDHEVAAGQRKPDDPQMQLTGEGWRIWGGDIDEPVSKTVAEVYLGVLEHGTIEQAQEVLDMTRKRCGELRLAAKNRKGKEAKELEDHWDKLHKELGNAVRIKIEKGLSSVPRPSTRQVDNSPEVA
jgi:hypothetical protein